LVRPSHWPQPSRGGFSEIRSLFLKINSLFLEIICLFLEIIRLFLKINRLLLTENRLLLPAGSEFLGLLHHIIAQFVVLIEKLAHSLHDALFFLR